MKKSIWMVLLISIPMISVAQNTWEKPEAKQEASKNTNIDEKYLEGAVPVVDGKVVYRKTFDAPGKTAFELYNIVGKYLQSITNEEGQINSLIVSADTTTFEIGASYEEWMQFKSNFLSLDRAHFYYTLQAVCQNEKVTVEMTHIRYLYDEYRKPQRLKAEEWITDKEALNKKKTKLLPISGKFRRKTVDRKDVLFNNLEALLK